MPVRKVSALVDAVNESNKQFTGGLGSNNQVGCLLYCRYHRYHSGCCFCTLVWHHCMFYCNLSGISVDNPREGWHGLHRQLKFQASRSAYGVTNRSFHLR